MEKLIRDAECSSRTSLWRHGRMACPGAHHELNPRLISLRQGVQRRLAVVDLKVYENVAQCAGGAASTTDSGRSADRECRGVVTEQRDAPADRHSPALLPGRRPVSAEVSVSMQDACSTCAGSSCATRNARASRLSREYPPVPNERSPTPCAGRHRGWGREPVVLKCKEGRRIRTHTLFHDPGTNWELTCLAVASGVDR